MKPIVQISLDIVNIPEALETAHMAMRAGVDWLEAGTPLIIAEGMNGDARQWPHVFQFAHAHCLFGMAEFAGILDLVVDGAHRSIPPDQKPVWPESTSSIVVVVVRYSWIA